MTFNADDYLDSLEHPAVILNGETYTGRILNIEEWLPYSERLRAFATKYDQREWLTFMRDYLKAIFPPTSFVPWRKPLYKRILDHPLAEAMVTDFLALQAAGLQGKPRRTVDETTPEN